MHNLCRTLNRLRLHTCDRSLAFNRVLTASKSTTTSTTQRQPAAESNVPKEKIIIPTRIERSPTDILMALSATVGYDPTAPHYKYHDDPYLIPTSNANKKTFALAQEAGRKAAHWIRQENAKLFQHQEADPPIQAFVPTMLYTEESQVETTDLQKLIDSVEVKDAILVYNLLKKNGIEVSDELKQQMLELLCFYNHEDTLPEQFIEERWFRQGTVGRERQRKTWKDFELAEEIFHGLGEKRSEHYCAMIRGMARYFQVEKAWALYQETVEKGIELDTNTFNSLLHIASFLKESYDKRWDLVCEVLTAMKQQGLRPNLGTLNGILQTITTIGGYNHPRTYALKTLAEFKKLGIEPSLASWYYMLVIFCRERGPVSHVLHDIMNEVEGKAFNIQDPKDTFFFVTAMDVCRNHLHDKELAKRVNQLLHHGDNYNLIGDSYKESIYYRHYFTLLATTEPLESFLETYHLLVPNVYIPEPSVMEDILKSVEMNTAIEHVPLLWSHMVQFDHTGRENLVNLLLHIMVSNQPVADEPRHADLVQRFANIGWDLYSRMEERAAAPRATSSGLSGPMLGDILLLCARANDYEKAMGIFTKLSKDQNSVIGEARVDGLGEFINLCISNRTPSMAIQCLQYCSENGYPESAELGRHIFSSFALDQNQVAKIKSLVGAEAVKPIN
ncbi:small ribosomal subunit protein mS39 [Anopheles ziemanni]|uniref:small ribosomal subunit protein mS39 n=1 Tax=Anopheles coustani TaxID=139045 RepID=UPI002658CE02|nr:small ribosomal subunit protein mS39 [Anopheles coustani]XP_058175465.1 small ribosomal subunit protein mS39 [Anopheles ziemanni]